MSELHTETMSKAATNGTQVSSTDRRDAHCSMMLGFTKKRFASGVG